MTFPTFEELIQLERTAPGRYERDLDRTFFGAMAQFGGYSMALCLEAMIAELDDPSLRPRVYNQQFAGPVQDGPCHIEVTTERRGKRSAQLTARISTSNGQCGSSSVSFVADRDAPVFDDLEVPAVDPIGDEERGGEVLRLPVPIHDRYDFFPRFDTGAATPSVAGGWVRVKEPCRWGPSFLLHLSDLWPPPTLQIEARTGMMLSFEHLAHLDAVGGDSETCGPFLVRTSSGRLTNGLSDEDIEIWDADRRLLVRARQHRIYV